MDKLSIASSFVAKAGDLPGFSSVLAHEKEVGGVALWRSEFGVGNRFFRVRFLTDGQEAVTALQAETNSHDNLMPYLASREITLCQEATPFKASVHDAENFTIFEFREYRLFPGTVELFLQHMLTALEFREQYSPNVCVWRPITGEPDRLHHMWAYESLEHRVRVRNNIANIEFWSKYRQSVLPLIRDVHSSIFAKMN